MNTKVKYEDQNFKAAEYTLRKLGIFSLASNIHATFHPQIVWEKFIFKIYRIQSLF